MEKRYCLFTAILLSFLLSSFLLRKKEYLITDFGAVSDGSTLNTKAVQQAIDRCAAGGGGTVVVPAGTFVSGAVFLKDRVSLRIDEGGVLKGSVDPEDYPQIDTRWEGEEKKWTACLVNAIGLTGIKLSGKGKIDGSGDVWTEKGRGGGLRWGKPRLVGLQNCSRVEVSGLWLHNQASWGLFVLYSRKITLSGLKITAAHNIPSSDGIDIDSGNKIRIIGCTIDVNDDCISIKSGKDEDGLRVARPCENILVKRCTFQYGHGGVAMGSETSGGIRNVVVKNCVVEADNWAPIRFKSQPSRGGVVENITYRNILLKNTRKAFEFNMAWRMVNPKPPAKVLPVVRNIKLINVRGTVQAVGDMRGLADSPIKNVAFKRCRLSAKKGLLIEHAENIDTGGLKVTGVEGPVIIYKR